MGVAEAGAAAVQAQRQLVQFFQVVIHMFAVAVGHQNVPGRRRDGEKFCPEAAVAVARDAVNRDVQDPGQFFRIPFIITAVNQRIDGIPGGNLPVNVPDLFCLSVGVADNQ